jgi:CopG family nickel-responsive transcriptional regulator
MTKLIRFSVSIEEPLYERMEKLVAQRHYDNRSEFIRDLVRENLVAVTWKQGEAAVGTITLVYKHHQRRLSEKLTHIQHHHHQLVMSATHIHLDHDLCVEAILVKGPAGDLQHMADELRKLKGVLHAALSMSSTGHDLD